MNQVNALKANIPPHVSSELVVDFNYAVMPEGIDNPFDIWDNIARTTPEIFYTPQNQGHWVVRGSDKIYDLFRDCAGNDYHRLVK